MDRRKARELEALLRDEYGNIAGIVIASRGRKIFEGYFNGYAAENALHVFSVTKSVFSALIGIALDRGCLGSVEQKVLSFFPEYSALPGETTIQKVALKDLLTMTAPYKYEAEPYELFFSSPDPIKAALDLLGGGGTIGKFRYSAIGGTHILSGVLSRATGVSALEFASEHLFSPLGIDVAKSIVIRSAEEHAATMGDRNAKGWVVDPRGRSTASWGLFLTPTEMAKIGQLYLDEGRWEGRRILPARWVAESSREHSRCEERGGLGYGYLWWVLDDDSYAALGDGGNVIYVNRASKLVVAIASLFAPDAKDRIELIKRRIEPLVQG